MSLRSFQHHDSDTHAPTPTTIFLSIVSKLRKVLSEHVTFQCMNLLPWPLAEAFLL